MTASFARARPRTGRTLARLGLIGDFGPRKRRRAERYPSNVRLVLDSGTGTCEAWTVNVSSGGLRAIVNGPIAIGDVCRFELAPNREQGPVRIWASGTARVVWAKSFPDGTVIGLQFSESTRARVRMAPHP